MARLPFMTRRMAGTTFAVAALATLAACAGPSANPPAHQMVGVIPASTPDNDPDMASALALSQYIWRLDRVQSHHGPDAFTLPGAAEKRPELRFVLDDGRDLFKGSVVVTKLCNTHSGAYTVNRDAIKAGPFMSTMKGCLDPELNRLERALGQQLPKMVHWQIEPWIQTRLSAQNHPASPTLRIRLNDVSEWTLTGRPTDELLHGGEAKRVFWEVAPQTVRCGSGTCLHVRTLTYNDQGIKQHTGEWREFKGEIKGFRHDPQYRQVLRLKHWEATNTYVLDMVVENEIVR